MSNLPFAPEVPPPFRPVLWARGRHAQTIAGHLLKSDSLEPTWERLTLKLSDGDGLRVKLHRGSTDTVVYLFHGLGDNTDTNYMRRLAGLFFAKGHNILAANHRGTGEGRGLAEWPYHSGSTADVAAVLQIGRGFFPDHRHVAIGFSFSGNILLLLQGRDGDSSLSMPNGAIAVNPPVDLELATQRLSRGFNRLYDHHVVKLLIEETKDRWELGLHTKVTRITEVKTLREYDDMYTAIRAGYKDRDTYYARCSSGQYLSRIRVPTVILCSEDDPIAPACDCYSHPRSDAVHLHIEKHGGHMGYIASNVPGYRWLDIALDHYVDELRKVEM